MSTTAEVGEQIRLALSIIFMGKPKKKKFSVLFFKEMFTIFFFLSFILMGPFKESWLVFRYIHVLYYYTGEYNIFYGRTGARNLFIEVGQMK